MMTTDMEKVLDKIKVNLDNWCKLHLTLWSKVDTIKKGCGPTNKLLNWDDTYMHSKTTITKI